MAASLAELRNAPAFTAPQGGPGAWRGELSALRESRAPGWGTYLVGETAWLGVLSSSRPTWRMGRAWIFGKTYEEFGGRWSDRILMVYM